MSASAVESEVREKVRKEDLVSAWLGMDINFREEGIEESLVNRVAEKVGLSIPREHVGNVYIDLMDMFRDVLSEDCRKTEMEVLEPPDEGSVSLYTCYLPRVGYFYVVESRADFPSDMYRVSRMVITSSREEARRRFIDFMRDMPPI